MVREIVNMAPKFSFGDIQYWDERFKKEDAFEWLLDFKAVEPVLRNAVESHSSTMKEAQLLHIGCGSSTLSTDLRHVVQSPEQVHNVDYSGFVVERGREREANEVAESAGIDGREQRSTRWSTLDLLSLDKVLEFVVREGMKCSYDIILDKSTSDAISCASDVEITLPCRVQCRGSESTTSVSHDSDQTTCLVHPLYILALHLAYLAAPGCHWLVFSYSNERFSFWDPEAELEAGIVLPESFVRPSQLWRLVKREQIAKPSEPSILPSTVHRPPEIHHLYVLERTDASLRVA